VVEQAFRRAILAAVGNRGVESFMRRYGMRLGAARFVAGETLDEAVPVLRGLNDRGLRANTTLLGEGTRERAHADAATAAYGEILERLVAERLRCNVALKLTHLGLALDEELAYANVRSVVARAAELGSFVRIDMEESRWVDATLAIYRRLRGEGLDNVGTVLQAYLYRSLDDLRALVPLGPNLRLVKGAYLEPASLAYPRKPDVDEAYRRLIELALAELPFTAVATHDESMIELALARGEPGRLQLQLLYGVRTQLQLALARAGHDVLVATPFGPEWYPYLMRRLAERPANLLFLLRSVARDSAWAPPGHSRA
jgi:proline dehydrogenase